jgi:light-harvesting protein B-800-850 alpha chain
MNQGRIWCVVHPTVGLPLFLASVALTSLAVHTAVMTHTTWMSSYWAGATRTKVSALDTPAQRADAGYSVTVSPATVAGSSQQAAFVITFTPKADAPAKATPAASPVGHAPAVVPIRSASAG